MRGDAYSLMLRYRELAHAREAPGGWGMPPAPEELPNRQLLHALWASGAFERMSDGMGGLVRVIDPGFWNRGPGPDFEGVHLEINGKCFQGDVVLTCCADDPLPDSRAEAYAPVALQLAACPPRGIRTACGASGSEIPLLVLPAEQLRKTLDLPPRRPVSEEEMAAKPLEKMPFAAITSLLRAAAACRLHRKHRRFSDRRDRVGASQAWYEAWAETLGYSANKQPMQLLAARVPLVEARENPEAVLFGTAGFLVPTLPERTTDEARAYHAGVWRSWWNLRDQYELMGERAILWSFSGQRPQNHPHRRVAALAASVASWEEMEPLMTPGRLEALIYRATRLRHPYWSTHVSLPSAPGARETALVGRERAIDFAVNHVFPGDGGETAWNMFVRLRASAPAAAVVQAAASLWGERPDLAPLLRLAYIQQGLLQLREDFGVSGPGGRLCFAPSLGAWRYEG